MKDSEAKASPVVSFEALFPNLDPREREAAEERFDRYLEIVLRIYERVRADPETYRQFLALTGRDGDATIDSTDHVPRG